jgi:cysteine synthase A
MQGWTPDFIPKLTSEGMAQARIESIVPIAGAEAIETSRALAAKEGIFVGITSGATMAGALKVAAKAPQGSNILAMLPDTAERYLSTPLFAEAGNDMSAEEQAIFDSTPLGRDPS